ncbi:MAG: YHS domain-containing protein [Zestosphaera sp.]
MKWLSTSTPCVECRLTPSKTPYKTVYKGRIYYFCSKRCLEEFERSPEYYLTQGPQGMTQQR